MAPQWGVPAFTALGVVVGFPLFLASEINFAPRKVKCAMTHSSRKPGKNRREIPVAKRDADGRQ
jgi:hypothetical protein